MKIGRLLIAAAAVCAVAVVPVQAATAAPVHGTASQASTRSQASSQAGSHLPYTDPQQAGWLTLCGVNLKPVTQGNINTKPFVWRVVSNVPAPKVYFRKGATAVMYAYQPREQTPAGAWSGSIMATPSYYSNRLHPMAQFTPIDEPLSYMTIAYHPIFDHLIQLRLYLGAPGMEEDESGYAAADLQVIGNTWRLVAGGGASCTSGKAISKETVVGMPGARGKPKPQAGAAKEGTSSPSSSSGSGGSSTASSGSGAGGSGTGSSGSFDAAHTSSAGPLVAGLAGAVVIVVALLASAVVWRRRRRIAG
ncbi:MAG TPA: hypothetical protein VMA72_00885 [Streptosporangiaceae bacterium]|nr:hypothetical protein [Streptosporangiaceae bacterium]